VQDPNIASQEPAKQQEKYAARDLIPKQPNRNNMKKQKRSHKRKTEETSRQ
jgi:hypothetical protein